MKNYKPLLAVVALFTIFNASIAFGATDIYKNVFSGFKSENPDSDLDLVPDEDDPSRGSPFDLIVITKDGKKAKVALPFGEAFLRLTKIKGNERTVKLSLETATNNEFTKAKKYSVAYGKIVTLPEIGKRVRVLYGNKDKGIAVIWMSELESAVLGCTIEESCGRAAAEQ